VFDTRLISIASPVQPKKVRKGIGHHRVINFGEDDNNPGTAFTGGPFDQHDTAATTALAEDDNTTLASFEDSVLSSHVVACIDAEQIERDVTRCTWHLLTGGQRSRRRVMLNKHRKKISRILRRKQRRLGDLINLTLAVSEVDLPMDQRLCYYQGYHDVASIFLAALGGASTKAIEQQQQADAASASQAAVQAASLGLEMSSKVLYQVSLSHFREPMRTNFLHLQITLRIVLFPLLHVMDPEVHAHLYGCGMEPFFALPWVLTWFSHDIRDTTVVKRLFDFFLCSHPLMPIYLTVAMLCNSANRQEILATPCEFAELHSVLAGLPKNSSMVGWKYRVGDGYISDDEQVGEDGETSISLDSDMASHLSTQNSTNRGPSLLSGMDTLFYQRIMNTLSAWESLHMCRSKT
jgi:TBC1 domain family member 20